MSIRFNSIFREYHNGPHVLDEISCTPETIFLNFNTDDKNKAMEYLDDIKERYSINFEDEHFGDEQKLNATLEYISENVGWLTLDFGASHWDENMEKYEYHEDFSLGDYTNSFKFFKIIDGASDFYKKNVITQSDSFKELDDDHCKFLSFFHNESEWDLKKLVSKHIIFENISEINEILASNLLEYVRGFNKHLQLILNGFKFYSIVEFLRENNLLLNLLVGLYAIDLNEFIFNDLNRFKECYNLFEDSISLSGNLPDQLFLPRLLFSDIDLKNRTQISIYDPSCSTGRLLIDCYNFIKKINPTCMITLYGCCTDPNDYSLCLIKMLFTNQNLNNFSLVEGMVLQQSLKTYKNNTFDFIISNFKNPDDFLSFKSNLWENIPSFEKKFNDKVVILTSFYNLNSRYDITSNIKEDIFDSLIHLPFSIESNSDGILILNKNKTEKRKDKFLLIDEYNQNLIYELNELPKKVMKNILNYYFKFRNYKNGKVFHNSKAGLSFNFQGLMYDKNVEVIETDLPIYNFIHIAEEGSSEDSYLYIPKKLKDFDKIAYFEIPSDINPDKFLRVSLKPCVLKDYLYYYLNSNKARNDISYLTLNFRDFNSLFYLNIPVPSIDEQEKIVSAARKMESFFNAMDIWNNNYSNNILNYENSLRSYEDFSCSVEFSDNGSIDMCPRWKIVYQGLIWPLAAAYLKAIMGSDKEDTRKKNHLVFFEFITSFNVIILISAIKNSAESIEEYDKMMDTLWSLKVIKKKPRIIYDYTSWHRMTFGSWTTLYGNLNKIFKNNKFSTVIDREFFENLASNKYKKLFNKLREKERNSDSHGGFQDDIDVSIKLQELERYMDEDMFGLLKLYSGFKLFYTVGPKDPVSPNKTEYTIIHLNGPCDPPHNGKIITSFQLNPRSLYLYDSLNDNFLELDSDLIKFSLIPNSKKYGIYIYDGINLKENVALYKCYYDKKPLKIPLKTDEDTFLKVSDDFLKYALRI